MRNVNGFALGLSGVFGLLVLAGLSACDHGAVELPACGTGEAVGFDDSGQPACRSLGETGTPPPLPSCNLDEALTVEGGAVHCVPRSDNDDFAGIAAQVATLKSDVAAVAGVLSTLPPAYAATFVGQAKQSNGFIAVGNLSGIPAAAAICKEQFGAGSHLCTPYELHLSASLGMKNELSQLRRAWVYFPAWNNGAQVSPIDSDSGVADTCVGYSYPSSSLGYRGVDVEWAMLPSGASGFYLHGGTESRCVHVRPLACCR